MKNRIPQKSSEQYLWMTSCVAVILLLAACAPHRVLLNSDRIAARYGSYNVQVLQQQEAQRVSSLASRRGERLITRTLAITHFAEPQAAYAEIESEIRNGASIGSSFRGASWAITKQTLHVGSISVSSRATNVAQLMDVALPRDLAIHIYRFIVTRGDESFEFATILELHHPDYMQTKDLRRIYGSSAPASDAEVAALRSAATRTLLELSSKTTP